MNFSVDHLGGESEEVFGPEQKTFRCLREDDATFTPGDGVMKRQRWSAQEIQMIQDRYPEEGPKQLAQELGRSPDSVSSFAHRCGLRTRRWLNGQEARLSPADPAGAAGCTHSPTER